MVEQRATCGGKLKEVKTEINLPDVHNGKVLE
jgi:hypothetical protein